jgi:hypothetical protein
MTDLAMLQKLVAGTQTCDIKASNQWGLSIGLFEDELEALVLTPIGHAPENIPGNRRRRAHKLTQLDVGPIYTVDYRDQMYVV